MNSNDLLLLRKRLGLSQKDMSKKLGVNQSQVSRWERDILPLPEYAVNLIKCLWGAPSDKQ